MAWVDIVGMLAVVQLFVFGVLVARARGTYGVAAPATTGHPMFERYYRVQVNTVECLIVFLPALWLAAYFWNPRWASILGAVWLAARIWYARAYVRDPGSRSGGFGLSFMAVIVLLIGAAIGWARGFVAA